MPNFVSRLVFFPGKISKQPIFSRPSQFIRVRDPFHGHGMFSILHYASALRFFFPSIAHFLILFHVQNYRGNLNHKNTPDFVKEFEQEHKGIHSFIHLLFFPHEVLSW